MPSYTGNDEGVLVEAVMDGKPAQAAGVKDGDIIFGLGEHDIKNIQDYMKALGTFEKGMETTVKIKRGDEKLALKLTF
jgi:S1-C subfamily serine protease